ncbi:FadR/GntR family transcriptional regulator [Enterocloster aldenensis]|uniref:FadR/GntR family transcriptional regulator n=1 Tax=Enterocloster aldenensis TaxID=358742 RepID=UPI0040285B25
MYDLLTASKRESAVDIVINDIKQSLINRRLLPGDRLPNELEIAEGLGVSRGSVREAMKTLSAFGLVDIKVGNGTFVCGTSANKLIESLLFTFFITNPDMDSLYEFRHIFELDILEMILKHYNQNIEERAALEKKLSQLRNLIDNEASADQIMENDIEFHQLLGNACHNSMAIRFMLS